MSLKEIIEKIFKKEEINEEEDLRLICPFHNCAHDCDNKGIIEDRYSLFSIRIRINKGTIYERKKVFRLKIPFIPKYIKCNDYFPIQIKPFQIRGAEYETNHH